MFVLDNYSPTMKKLILVLSLISLNSCYLFQENGIDFKIINNSDLPISDVKFSTTENLDSATFRTIEADQSEKGFLSMKNNRSDGSYTLSFKRKDGSQVESGGGYYTNGGSLDSWIRFEIKNDTILMKLGDFPK